MDFNSTFIEDLSKGIKQESIKQRLDPGSPRRYDPIDGIKKHNDRIHRDSKIADSKNLQFSFSKPKKSKRSMLVTCDACGFLFNANINTVGIICRNCNKFSSVSEYKE